MGSIKEEDHENESSEEASPEAMIGTSSKNLDKLISPDSIKMAVAQKKEQIMQKSLSNPKKYLLKPEDTHLSFSNQR